MLGLSGRQYLLVAVLLVLALAPSITLGANILPSQIVPESCSGPGGCKDVCAIAELAQNILNAAIVLAVFLSAALFAWAGLKMLVSPASPAQQGQAKTLFFNVLVGFLIILAAWLIIDTVMHVMLGSSFGPWNKIC
ncbi:MAG TPA: hypothetical protein VJG64_01600 [Candidatus Paceibacterota bacterium]